MVSAKKQGPFEVFSHGVEEPWSIWRDGRPFKQVWTWVEVEKILSGDDEPKKATPKKARKTKAQLERERELSQRWLVTFQMPGSQWAYVARTGSGSTMSPDSAFDFGSREAAESHAATMQGPRSSLRAKVTSRPKP